MQIAILQMVMIANIGLENTSGTKATFAEAQQQMAEACGNIM
jgi:hypothetical protein